jgi:hypothetical protein
VKALPDGPFHGDVGETGWVTSGPTETVARGLASDVKWTRVEPSRMPQVELGEETVSRLDSLREEDESYDEVVAELINIYETEELTLFHGGDEV